MDRDPLARRSPPPRSRRSGARARAADPGALPNRRGARPQGPARPRPGAARREPLAVPGLDAFWLEADQESSGEHPIERELGHRLDALARYGQLIETALADGRERAAELLMRQREREEEIARRLRRAIDSGRPEARG